MGLIIRFLNIWYDQQTNDEVFIRSYLEHWQNNMEQRQDDFQK